MGYFYGGFARVKLNEKWGFINKEGKEIIGCKYDNVKYFHEGLVGIKLNNKWGFIDRKGVEIIECKYDNVDDFNVEGLARVGLNGEHKLINKQGDVVIELNKNRIFIFEIEDTVKKRVYINATNESGAREKLEYWDIVNEEKIDNDLDFDTVEFIGVEE